MTVKTTNKLYKNVKRIDITSSNKQIDLTFELKDSLTINIEDVIYIVD